MTKTFFLSKYKGLLAEKEKLLAAINEKYTALQNKYAEEHCPLALKSVYELLNKREGPKKFKRFVVYDRKLQIVDGRFIFLNVGGWWLDENSVPSLWKTYTVGGDISNPTKFVLSENQENKPHPDSK